LFYVYVSLKHNAVGFLQDSRRFEWHYKAKLMDSLYRQIYWFNNPT